MFYTIKDMNISARNEKIYFITECFNGLMFYMPVWVAFELQYISLAQLAIIEAIIQSSSLLSELPTGAIADLLGKKISVIIGRIIGVFAILLYAQSTSFSSFVIYAIVSGFGESFVSGAKDALIYDSYKQDQKENNYPKAAAKASLIFQLSFAAAIIIGGILSLWGYRIAIYTSAAAYACALIGSFFFQEPIIDTAKFTLHNYIRQIKMGFYELFKTPYIRDISLFYIAVGGITWAGMMIFNTSLLTTIGFRPFDIGIIVACIRLINSSIIFGALHRTSLLTKRRAYLLFPIIMLLSYLPGYWLTKWVAIASVAGSIFASSSRFVILGSYVNEQYDSRHRAVALSTLSMLVSVAVILFAMLSSPVMAFFNNVGAMYTIMGVTTALIVLPLGIRIRNRYHS